MYALIMCTCSSTNEADLIAETLIEEQLAACIQQMPIQSVYRWQGKVEKSGEILLLIKTRTDLFEKVSTRIQEIHSYDVPEIIQLPITDGLPAYLEWISDSTSRRKACIRNT